MAACRTDLWYRLSGSADYAGQLSHGQTDRPVHLAVLALLCRDKDWHPAAAILLRAQSEHALYNVHVLGQEA